MERKGLVDERGIAIDASLNVKLENNNDPPRLNDNIPATPRTTISIFDNLFNCFVSPDMMTAKRRKGSIDTLLRNVAKIGSFSLSVNTILKIINPTPQRTAATRGRITPKNVVFPLESFVSLLFWFKLTKAIPPTMIGVPIITEAVRFSCRNIAAKIIEYKGYELDIDCVRETPIFFNPIK